MIFSSDTHLVSASMIAPVPSVPIRAFTLNTTTTIALTMPRPRVASIVKGITSQGDKPVLAMNQAHSTPANPAMLPTETSNTPDDSGITTLIATRPVTASLLRTERSVSSVGNVSGFKIVKKMMIAIHTYTAPIVLNDSMC